MKPRMRERPIQAWDVRVGESVGAGSAGSCFSTLRAETSPGAVGVRGGSSLSKSTVTSAGMTGPGIASNEEVSGPSRSSRLSSHLGHRKGSFL